MTPQEQYLAASKAAEGKMFGHASEITLSGNPFIRVIDHLPPRKMYVHVWAKKNGVGKSRFAVDAPAPVYMLSTDAGEHVAVMQSPNGGNVYSTYFPLPGIKPALQDYKNLKAKFEHAWTWTLENIPHGTIVVDTATQVKYIAEVAMLTEKAEKRKGGKPIGFDYAEVNLWWANLLHMLDQTKLNAIFISKGRELWTDSGQPSGDWEAKAHEAILDFVHISGEIRMESKKDALGNVLEPLQYERTFHFEKNRFNPEMVGLSLPGSMVSFNAMLDLFWPNVNTNQGATMQ